MADDELTPEPTAEPTAEPTETAEPAVEPAVESTPEPGEAAAAVAAAADAGTDATPAAATQPFPAERFAEAVRQRLLTANYGVSAGIGVSCVQRDDGDLLLIFEAKEAAEALQAASAALATVPDDETRVWRFAGSGPDLESGRARAVVRISRPTAAPAQ